MKTQLKLAALALLSAFSLQPSALLGQGSLTPPGAPAPTMKSLDQVEARTPISSVPFTISNSGSYYLTTNLTTTVSNAIVITANGVTLDLSGFTIFSTVPSAANGGTAILLAGTATVGLSDITIVNGHIRSGVTNNGSGVYSGSGFNGGIFFSGNVPVNTRVSGVSVAFCLTYGIFLNNVDSTVVEACTVRTVGSYGIIASTIKGSVAVDCGYDAIDGDQVSDCRGQSTGYGNGLYASSTAQNCYGQSSSGTGLYAITAQNCYGSSGSYYGLSATTALNCYGSSSSVYGLDATTAQNCYGQSSSGDGLYANTAQNCFGQSSSGSYGLYAYTALNCWGYSSSGTGLYVEDAASGCLGQSGTGTGLWAFCVNNCRGETSGTAASAYGIYAYDIATGSYGSSGTGGVGLRANIANSCDGTSLVVNHKYNMCRVVFKTGHFCS